MPVGASDESTLLDRVRKLLALSGSDNPHEAEAAAKAAQALVSKYRLEAALAAAETKDAAIEAVPIKDGREAPLEVARRLRKWKRVLGQALAEANGGSAWVDAVKKGEERLCVVGCDADRATIQALYDGLVKRIEWASATAGEGKPRRWHEAFRIGVVDALVPRLNEAEAEARAQLETKALTVIDRSLAAHRDALERYLDAHFVPGKSKSLRVDAEAYAAGQREGARMDPDPTR